MRRGFHPGFPGQGGIQCDSGTAVHGSGRRHRVRRPALSGAAQVADDPAVREELIMTSAPPSQSPHSESLPSDACALGGSARARSWPVALCGARTGRGRPGAGGGARRADRLRLDPRSGGNDRYVLFRGWRSRSCSPWSSRCGRLAAASSCSWCRALLCGRRDGPRNAGCRLRCAGRPDGRRRPERRGRIREPPQLARPRSMRARASSLHEGLMPSSRAAAGVGPRRRLPLPVRGRDRGDRSRYPLGAGEPLSLGLGWKARRASDRPGSCRGRLPVPGARGLRAFSASRRGATRCSPRSPT